MHPLEVWQHVCPAVHAIGPMTVGWLVVNAEQARSLACSYPADDLPQRWRHVQGVARRASQIGPFMAGSDDTLVCAAWLHDIGYAPAMGLTGFHPLDGARFLAAAGVSKRLAGSVAHHSCAELYGHLYPGEMDRYADRLNEAAGMSDQADDAAKMRPDDDLDEDESEQDD